MISKYDKIFRDNVTTYALNRLSVGIYESAVVDEIMSRFPIFVGLYKCDSETQKSFISWLVHGINQGLKVNKINKGE